MMQPKTVDDYLDLVDQAIYETDEVLMCAADEGDPEDSDFSGILPVFEQLSRDLKSLHEEVRQGRHLFGQGDLAFMPLVQQWKRRIPYYELLLALNNLHRQGLGG
jgi:hypothetical protein